MSASEQPPGPPSEGPPPPPVAQQFDLPAPPDYPARVEIDYTPELNRWLPLVKWLLVIPHLFALFFVGIGAFFVGIWAFFAVLFTGRWPQGAFDYLLGTFRWAYRVVVYMHLMVDPYPPFSMADDPNYPVRVHIDYPEHIDNWRPLVQWLLAIPYLIVASVLLWLTGVLGIIAFFTILFTKQIPRGVFDLMVPGLRWQVRGNSYAYFLTDRYPPFTWE